MVHHLKQTPEQLTEEEEQENEETEN